MTLNTVYEGHCKPTVEWLSKYCNLNHSLTLALKEKPRDHQNLQDSSSILLMLNNSVEPKTTKDRDFSSTKAWLKIILSLSLTETVPIYHSIVLAQGPFSAIFSKLLTTSHSLHQQIRSALFSQWVC